jgi:hypothetical protein
VNRCTLQTTLGRGTATAAQYVFTDRSDRHDVNSRAEPLDHRRACAASSRSTAPSAHSRTHRTQSVPMNAAMHGKGAASWGIGDVAP